MTVQDAVGPVNIRDRGFWLAFDVDFFVYFVVSDVMEEVFGSWHDLIGVVFDILIALKVWLWRNVSLQLTFSWNNKGQTEPFFVLNTLIKKFEQKTWKMSRL